jgi:rhodanese-related sulfurtransferase
MSRTIFSLCVALLLSLSSAAVGEDGARSVEPKDVAAVVGAPDGPLLLDVRTPEEYAAGHLPGARHVPLQELEARLGELAPYQQRGVIAYCESGRRADKALDILRDAGFQNLGVVAGSMARWRSEGLPVEKTP